MMPGWNAVGIARLAIVMADVTRLAVLVTIVRLVTASTAAARVRRRIFAAWTIVDSVASVVTGVVAAVIAATAHRRKKCLELKGQPRN